MATQAELASHLFIGQPTVSRLKNKGILPPPTGRGGFDLDACRQAYIEQLREAAAGRDSSRVGSLEAERARLAREQADSKAMDNAERRKELVSLPDVSGAVISVLSLAVTELQKVGITVANGDHKLRRRIDAVINDVLENLSATKVIEISTSAGAADEDGDDSDV